MINTTYYPMTDVEALADFQRELAVKILTIEFEI